MSRLAGKICIVTGASRGIGAATARELARRGAMAIVAARDGAACERVAEAIRGAGGAAEAAACDVAAWDQVEALVEGVAARHGRIDALVNNAGVIEPIARLAESDPAAWARAVAVNLTGAYHGCRAVLPHFRRAGGGVIVNVSSGAADKALEGWSAYCAGKAGLRMLTRALHLETRGQGVRVYGLQPGVVDTEMQARIRASALNPMSRLRREVLAPAEAPARVIAWLCGGVMPLAGRELQAALLAPAWVRLMFGLVGRRRGPPARR